MLVQTLDSGETRTGTITLQRESAPEASETSQFSALNALLRKMDLPINRKNVRKANDLSWLCRNMGIRNGNHPDYPKAREVLLALARDNHALKNSELRRMSQSSQFEPTREKPNV